MRLWCKAGSLGDGANPLGLCTELTRQHLAGSHGCSKPGQRACDRVLPHLLGPHTSKLAAALCLVQDLMKPLHGCGVHGAGSSVTCSSGFRGLEAKLLETPSSLVQARLIMSRRATLRDLTRS